MTALEDPDQFIRVGKTSWFTADHWTRLHAVPDDAWTEDHRADMAADWAVSTPVRLACGRTVTRLCIPGPFTRMGAMRCTGCCRATGLPPGKGAPVNSPECRAILGLDEGQAESNRPGGGI